MHYKTTTKPRPINEIKIGDDRIMTIDVGCGWAVTDVWFDHDIPVELIDCIKVKFERKETPQMSITNTNSGGNYSGIASVPEDIVNHPSHYETGKFECIDVMRETQGDEAVQDFCICNALKYIYRHRNKNGVEDIRKAKWYIDKYLEIEEAKK